ncbi:type II toxin-antitoxin system RelE/ParE family toxin [Adlercreutzia sp. ZJ154]|uniref:type II toxin-antitoxin system RelE family toxin n=1 Tax=Adlercreutzia sp. ZJ154 TaxID=2709790 RepID=UPI0013E9FD89|nr:type II toxin-antitoxin system RelE/ParE family toxin [Adlercreutzia sp. ZJ154]
MGYKVDFTRKAQKDLAKLDKRTQKIIASFIKDQLEGSTNPQALSGCKKLQGVQNGWRWRVGVYRLLGIVDGDTITIQLFRIGHRRDVYRRMN